MISDGFGYSFGILLNPLTEYYGADQNTVSLVGSIFFGTLLMSGPIAGKVVLIQVEPLVGYWGGDPSLQFYIS